MVHTDTSYSDSETKELGHPLQTSPRLPGSRGWADAAARLWCPQSHPLGWSWR